MNHYPGLCSIQRLAQALSLWIPPTGLYGGSEVDTAIYLSAKETEAQWFKLICSRLLSWSLNQILFPLPPLLDPSVTVQ